MIHQFIFSPSGTTAKIADALAGFVGGGSVTHDLTVDGGESIDFKDEDDVFIFAVPVYAGRIPALAAERLQSVSGRGQKAVAIVVYGNRDYDDALVELCDIVASRGFKVVAAGAFIAQHCIFPRVATGRPDAEDIEKLASFADIIRTRIKSGEELDLNSVKGNRPYKKAADVPLHPEVDEKKCNACAACASLCPTGAIDASDPKRTDASKCITCCRCINVCKQGARHFGGVIYKIAGWKFVRDNSRRLEPEWFV